MGFLRRFFHSPTASPGDELKRKYAAFRRLLLTNNEVLEQITLLETALASSEGLGLRELRRLAASLTEHVHQIVDDLNTVADGGYRELHGVVTKIAQGLGEMLRDVRGTAVTRLCIPLEEVTRDLADAVGGKTSNLGEVRNIVGLPVPPGFAVTAFAYRAFIEGSGLQAPLTRLWEGIDWDDAGALPAAADAMQQLVLAAHIPQEVREEITLNAHDLYRKAPGHPRISLRSSAIGEDSRASFAGQYSSFLNVPLEQVLRRYKEVVASKFSPRALFYMHSKGFREEEIAMSVGCFLMVDARAAGVAYSVDPADPELDSMLITGVWGLGKPLVDGAITPDIFRLSRRQMDGPCEVRPSRQGWSVRLDPAGGLVRENLPAELAGQPCLDTDQVRTLARYVLALEEHYRAPQDVEWVLDQQGRLFILQTRPLTLAGAESMRRGEAASTAELPVLVAGGATACPGAGAGPVVHVSEEDDLNRFPDGGVLVAASNQPRFVRVMTRAAAIVTEVGSVSGHMASLAREYAVPTITGLENATASLAPGVEVTVDATHCRIVAGRVEELLAAGRGPVRRQNDLPSLAVLERVVARVARLNLTDPARPSFRAKNCTTYHDVVRFCHEMAISEMFRINDYRNLAEEATAYRLDCDVPLGIYLIDLGGGLEALPGTRSVRAEQIRSVPMRALWRGMTTPGVRWAGARPIDARGFLSVWVNTMADGGRGERGLGDNSYAMVGSHFVNFGSRLGYHFTTLEAVCGESLHENYIIFRFKGGAADLTRRERRTRFVGEVLRHFGFTVDQKRDLLNAWVKKVPSARVEELLEMVGRLMGCARQLDVAMESEETVSACIEAFIRSDFEFFDEEAGREAR